MRAQKPKSLELINVSDYYGQFYNRLGPDELDTELLYGFYGTSVVPTGLHRGTSHSFKALANVAVEPLGGPESIKLVVRRIGDGSELGSVNASFDDRELVIDSDYALKFNRSMGHAILTRGFLVEREPTQFNA